jgi:putative ABC transport system permease protein
MHLMSVSDIWLLYRARLRARAVLVQEGFAIAGIAIGVALLFASQVASTSLTHSVARMAQQIVGNTQFQLDARGPRGLDERMLRQVRAVPGVHIALPVLEQQVNVVGPSGERSVYLLGVDPRFARFAGPSLRRFSANQLAAQQVVALPGPVAQAIGVGPLQTVKLQMGSNVTPALMGTTLGEGDIGELVHSPVAVAPVRYVQQIAGLHGRISRVFVQVRPGHLMEVHAALSALAQKLSIGFHPANFDSTLFSVAAAPATKGETLFSAISALVGFMFAINAMLMTVPARRLLIEGVHRQGATRTMAVQILAFDAAVLGTLACLVGLVLGDVLSIAVFHTNPGYLAFAFPVGNQRLITWPNVAVAVAAGFAAAGLGVLWPLRDLITRPLGAQDAHTPTLLRLSTLRLVGGIACLGITTVILIISPQMAVLAAFTLIVALMCLLPMLFDMIIDGFERLQRPFNGASPLLAVTELRTPQTRIRSLAIAATGAIAVFGVVAIQGAQLNLQRGLDASSLAFDRSADLWVLPRGEADAFVTVPFKGISARRLAAVRGVHAVGVFRGSFLDWGDRRVWVLAPPPAGAQLLSDSQLVKGDLASATARLRDGGWVVLSERLASEHHLRIGQAFQLPGPRPITVRIAALTTNLGWPPGAMVMNSGDYARAWASGEPSAYEIQLSPGASPSAVKRRVQDVLGPKAALIAETAAERMTLHHGTTRQGLARLTEIRILVLIAAVLAVAGAMVALIWQRREMVAFIKCHGYRQGILWRWLMCECALLLAAGCAVGAMFGVYGEVLLSHALAAVTGFPIMFHIGALIAFASFALVTVAAVAIVAVAGYFVVRVPPRTFSPAY